MGFSIRLFYLIPIFTIFISFSFFFAGLLIAANPAPMARLRLLFVQPPYSRQTVVVEQIKAPSVY